MSNKQILQAGKAPKKKNLKLACNRNACPVLMLIQLPPPVHGTATMNALAVAALQNVPDLEVHVINTAPVQFMQSIGRFNIRKSLHAIAIWGRLIIYIFRFRPGFCYMSLTLRGYGFYRDLVTIALLKLFRLKRIYHIHVHGTVRSEIKKHPWNQSLYAFAFRDSDIIVLSQRFIEEYRFLLVNERIHVLPNGIPDPAPKVLVDDVGESRMPQSKKPVILFLSNMFEEKGPLVLLSAVRLLKDRGLQFRVWIAGAGVPPLTEEFMKARVRELDLVDCVSIVGPLYGDAKIAAFRDADIFVHPTCLEAFGLVLLEAMAFALPVVSTFEGAIPDIVVKEETGLLVPPRDAVALASALEFLIQDPEACRRLGRTGRQYFETYFTDSVFCRSFADIICRDVVKIDHCMQCVRLR